jgi:hypothetical protein
MVADFERPFANIESAQEYVRLLGETLLEAQADIEKDLELAQRERAMRRQEALYLVHYKLAQLRQHLRATSHILNDLRTLRRLLLGERSTNDAASDQTFSDQLKGEELNEPLAQRASRYSPRSRRL